MNINVLYPLMYLFFGIMLGKTSINFKGLASLFLTKFIIPFVIVYNISTSITEMFPIMIGMILLMAIMLTVSKLLGHDAVENLCFCYLNIGWLGLPIAGALLGNAAATVILSAYIGSSIFGNSVGVGVMSPHESWSKRVISLLKAPPIIALAIGIVCVPIGPDLAIIAEPIYSVMKFLMSFFGMAILGVWLSQSTFNINGFKKSLVEFLSRSLIMSGIVYLLVILCSYFDFKIVSQNSLVLYLICLLPPAANIIVLETHYMKSGRSATMIAWGTCISLCAITFFILTIFYSNLNQ